MAAEYLGLQPDECIVVEDAAAGIEAAHCAGMAAISIGDAAEQSLGEYQIWEFAELSEQVKKISEI